MSQTRSKPTARLPLFDRILAGDGPDPSRSSESAGRALRDSIRRDLELLFNTRPRHRSAPAELTELQTSLLTFGLADLQTRPMAAEEQREAFRIQLEKIIHRFEPRLQNLVVEIPPTADALDRSLRFRIHAVLVTDAGNDPIVYDTLLDPASRNLAIAGDGLDAS